MPKQSVYDSNNNNESSYISNLKCIVNPLYWVINNFVMQLNSIDMCTIDSIHLCHWIWICFDVQEFSMYKHIHTFHGKISKHSNLTMSLNASLIMIQCELIVKTMHKMSLVNVKWAINWNCLLKYLPHGKFDFVHLTQIPYCLTAEYQWNWNDCSSTQLTKTELKFSLAFHKQIYSQQNAFLLTCFPFYTFTFRFDENRFR